jgi:PKD repeat protein/outer membrane protein assembly factor BamB
MHIDHGGRSPLLNRGGAIILILFLSVALAPIASAQVTGDPDHAPWMFRADPVHSGINDDGGITPAGILNWSFTTGGRVYSSPAIVNGTVFVGSDDNRVYAINSATGEEIWSYTTGDRVLSSPAVANGLVYVGSYDKKLYALDEGTGEEVWNYTTGGWVTSSPVVEDGVVYSGSLNDDLYAFNATTGELLWEVPLGSVPTVDSSPAVADGFIYATGGNGSLYALDSETGVPLWNFTLGSSISSSPAVIGGTVYVGNSDGRIYALNASTGDEIWNTAIGQESEMDSSPAVASGVVYVGSNDNNVYALNASTGAVLWNYTTGSVVYSSPTVANGIVYVGSWDHNMYALDAATGTKIWNYTTGDPVFSSPAVANGLVCFGSFDGTVYAIGPSPAPVAPVANFTANVTFGIIPMPVKFTDFSTGTLPLAYQWNFGDGTPNETARDPVHTYTDAGTYNVTLTVINGVGSGTLEREGYISAMNPVIVGGGKAWYLVHSNVDGAEVYFNGDSFEGVISNGTLLVQTCPTCTPVSSCTVKKCGYFTLTQPVTQHPGDNETVDLYANLTAPEEPLIADFSANITAGPSPLVVEFTSHSIGIAEAWNWSFGDGTYSEEQQPVHTYTADGVYNVSLYESNSACQNDTMVKPGYITVPGPVSPVASFEANETFGFTPMTVQFSDLSTGTQPLAYQWNFGDGSGNGTVQDPVHTYTEDGTYNVTLTVSNSAGTSTLEREGYITSTTQIIVGGGKAWYLVHSNVDGAEVYFNGDSFEGVISNGTLLVQTCPTCTPVFSFTVKKCGYFTLTQPNDQFPGDNQTVDLYAYLTAPKEPLIADFSANVTAGPSPLVVEFASHSIGIVQAWNWSFGDGTYSEEQQPVHTYTADGVYNVSLYESNSACQNDTMVKSKYINVGAPKPTFQANFTVSPTSGTAPLTVKCMDASVGNPTWFSYNFGDGITMSGPNPVHTYRFPGTYTITETISKYNTTTFTIMSSGMTKQNVITVGKVPFIAPVAQFTASPTEGTAPLSVTFTDESIGNPTFFNYDFGDGINMTGPDQVHQYRYPGIYNVTLTVLKNDPASGVFVGNSSVRTGLVVVNGP